MAHRHLSAAHCAAVAAGDWHLAAYALGWQAVVVGQGDPRAGLALARSARRQAGSDPPASVLAWLFRVEAESSAGQGNHYHSEQALDRLARAASRPRTERDPSWTYFIDDAQIAAYRGVCYVRLGRGADAETTLRQALDAAVTASEAFHLAQRTESPRTIERLNMIGRDLAPWQTLPEVEEFADLLTAHRYR